MSDFGPWVHNLASPDPALATLKQAAQANAPDWPYYSNERADYLNFVLTKMPAPDQAQASVLLGQLYEQWRQEQSGRRPGGFWRWVFDNLGVISLIGFGIVMAAGIGWALSQPNVLESLAREGQARGLITFLVAVSTIAVALLTSISIFYVPAVELENRYSKAKDLLTILVGILGTILGFYFGSVNNDNDAVPDQPVISAPAVDAAGTSDVAAEPEELPSPVEASDPPPP